MTAIDVTPAGNQRYGIDIEDADGRSHHDLGVPDHLVEQLAMDDVAMREVVRAAVEYLIQRQGRQQLDRDIDLGEIAAGDDRFVELVTNQARQRATEAGPATDQQADDRDERTSNERLLDEVREEQAEGQASRQDPHR